MLSMDKVFVDIILVNNDMRAKKANVIVGIFKDKATCEAVEMPLATQQFFFEGDFYPFTPANMIAAKLAGKTEKDIALQVIRSSKKDANKNELNPWADVTASDEGATP